MQGMLGSLSPYPYRNTNPPGNSYIEDLEARPRGIYYYCTLLAADTYFNQDYVLNSSLQDIFNLIPRFTDRSTLVYVPRSDSGPLDLTTQFQIQPAWFHS